MKGRFPGLTGEEEAAGAVSLASSLECEGGCFPGLAAEEEGADVEWEVNRSFCFSIADFTLAHIRSLGARGFEKGS